MKPKYGPQERPYTQDINDLVAENIEKGGVGSGKRGHTSPNSGRGGPISMNEKDRKAKKDAAAQKRFNPRSEMRSALNAIADKHPGKTMTEAMDAQSKKKK